MRNLRGPPPLRSSVQTARNFYRRCNAMPMYEHCREVLRIAREVDIVEGNVITDSREDMKRRMANHILAETILYHVVEPGRVRENGVPLPSAMMSDEVMQELEVYCKLTELERAGAPLADFAPILNNGHAPLALLAKLPDYSVTHNMQERLEGLVGEPARPMFRTYSSREEAYRSYHADAKAGEKLYAPLAELFGYPPLAGTILRHSYQVNHPSLYKHVMKIYGDEVMQQRLAVAQRMVREISRQLRVQMKSYGFEVRIQTRPVKSEGKLMRKMHRLLEAEFAKGANDAILSKRDHERAVERYVGRQVGRFDNEKIHDWVALRVVVNRFKGKEVDRMPEGELQHVLSIADKVVKDVILTLEMVWGESFAINFERRAKSNGYRAHHWDMRSMLPGSGRPMPFEVQLKTEEWHQIAEHGKAAHYYYIGGNPDFMEMIATTYQDIIHRNINGNGPPSRSDQNPKASARH